MRPGLRETAVAINTEEVEQNATPQDSPDRSRAAFPLNGPPERKNNRNAGHKHEERKNEVFKMKPAPFRVLQFVGHKTNEGERHTVAAGLDHFVQGIDQRFGGGDPKH